MDDLDVPSFLRSQTDGLAPPAFLRKRDRIIDRHDKRYWTESEHYSGLTPLGVSEWLRITPASDWPVTYKGLRQMGIGAWLVEWLELVVAIHGGAMHADSEVIVAFLSLMSERDTYDSLEKAENLLSARRSTVLGVRELLSVSPAATPASVDVGLVEAMVAGLDGMTTSAWPVRVFELDGVME